MSEAFRFTITSDIDELREEWAALAERSDDVFATHEWLATWWRHFGRGRRLLLTAVRDGHGELVAVLPLYLASTRPLRVVRFLGHGLTDQLGPVCAVADRGRARRAVASFLVDHLDVGWDVAIADDQPAGDEVGRGARVLRRGPTQVVSLADAGIDGAAWLAARSANLRSQLVRARRRLADQGTATYRTTEGLDRLDADLDLLLELHRQRWAAHGGSRSFAGREAFHRDVARTLLAQDRLRLRFLEVDGTAVAGLYSLRFDGVESHYQGGRDPAFDHCSVGLLLHDHAIRACADEGVREYRFLRGDEPYKQRLADRSVDQESIAWSRGPLGGATLSALAQLPRLSREQLRWVPASVAWGTGGSPRWGPP